MYRRDFWSAGGLYRQMYRRDFWSAGEKGTYILFSFTALGVPSPHLPRTLISQYFQAFDPPECLKTLDSTITPRILIITVIYQLLSIDILL